LRREIRIAGPAKGIYHVGDLIHVYPNNALWQVSSVGDGYLFVVRASRYRRVLAWIRRHLP
jgi:hypothetical protein